MKHPDVDRYLEDLPAERQRALRRVRELIHEVAPDAGESMKYRMPTYYLGESPLCAFASQKHHMSLYMDVDLVAKHGAALAHLNVGKSCIRFKRLDDLPLDTVRAILVETLAGMGAPGR